jgi:hypothetical protein
MMNASKLGLYDHHAGNDGQANGASTNLAPSSNSPSEDDSGGDDDLDGSLSRKRKRFSRPMNVTYVLAPS